MEDFCNELLLLGYGGRTAKKKLRTLCEFVQWTCSSLTVTKTDRKDKSSLPPCRLNIQMATCLFSEFEFAKKSETSMKLFL